MFSIDFVIEKPNTSRRWKMCAYRHLPLTTDCQTFLDIDRCEILSYKHRRHGQLPF